LATIRCASLFLSAGLFVAPANAASGETVARDGNPALTTVQRNLTEADAMLDSLRGDIYQAVLSGTRGDTEHIRQIQKEFAEHAKNLKTRIKANGELGIDPSLQSSLQALQRPLDAYIRSAEDLIAVAGDQEKAVPKLDGFQNVHEALGKTLRTFSDTIDARVGQRKQTTEQDTRFSRPVVLAILGIALLGLALLSLLGFAVYRNSARRAQGSADHLHADSGDLVT
jgi:hypothetical protein